MLSATIADPRPPVRGSGGDAVNLGSEGFRGHRQSFPILAQVCRVFRKGRAGFGTTRPQRLDFLCFPAEPDLTEV